jgi:DNA-directed RNA polymerase subunit H (RpoH/RPB5)
MNHKEDVAYAFETLVEMMEDRGVDTTLLRSFQKNELALLMTKSIFSVPVVENMKILFFLLPKFRTSDLKKHLQEVDSPKDHYVLVTKDKAQKLADLKDVSIEAFQLKELQFNISKHMLVPKHVKITDEKELQELKEKFKIRGFSQLPHILKTDPMARYLGLKPHDIVKIIRPSVTAGEYVSYRCCV